MTVKLASLKANTAREIEGDWVPFPRLKGVRFHVSAFTKPSYRVARDELHQRVAKKNGGTLPDVDEMRPHYAKLYVEEILHDWEGFDVDFSPEEAVKLLSDPEYRELFDAVEWCASQMSRIDVEYLEKSAGNSAPPSAGGSKAKAQTTG